MCICICIRNSIFQIWLLIIHERDQGQLFFIDFSIHISESICFGKPLMFSMCPQHRHENYNHPLAKCRIHLMNLSQKIKRLQFIVQCKFLIWQFIWGDIHRWKFHRMVYLSWDILTSIWHCSPPDSPQIKWKRESGKIKKKSICYYYYTSHNKFRL